MAILGKEPLSMIVDSSAGWEASILSKKIPKTTPPCYLQVEKILTSYDYNINNDY